MNTGVGARLGPFEAEDAVAALGWSRIGLGVAMALAPRLVLRSSGLSRDPDPAAVAVMRGFGVRDAVVGAAIVWAADADSATQARWFVAGAACDAADAAAMLLGRRLPGFGRMVWGLGAAAATAAGIAAARAARDSGLAAAAAGAGQSQTVPGSGSVRSTR